MRAIWAKFVEGGKIVRRAVILEDRECEECGKVFSPHKTSSRYCSRRCSVAANIKRHSHKVYLEDRECSVCKKVFHPKQRRTKCCSKKCRDTFYGKQHKDRNRHGGKRKELIEENGLVCSSCGRVGTENKIHAHHTTMDKTQHDFQELLCVSCHATKHLCANNPKSKILTKEQVEDAIARHDRLDAMAEYLGVSRSFLYKKRIEYGFPSRVFLRGRKK